MAGYDYRGSGNYSEPAAYSNEDGGSQYGEPIGQQPNWSQPPEPPPTPWYLKPFALIGWGVLTAILLSALVWGMVRLVNRDTGHTEPTTTTVSSTVTTPADEPAAPTPQPAAPEAPSSGNLPSVTPTEPPVSTSETTAAPTSTAPTTTQTPTTTAPTTTAPPTTTQAPTTTQPPATTSGATRPSEIVIPLPPGL